eukprot:TRINITY_DN107483_c0_g1_i1.p1 TRINITY_DN107483_c0_g1~~TRINITY_DN107483_c0_g1_i1.p1  ORF type:complete len:318 (+),score=77.47 TRINITY_DN107483_c0_g1_i1:38-955(+)
MWPFAQSGDPATKQSMPNAIVPLLGSTLSAQVEALERSLPPTQRPELGEDMTDWVVGLVDAMTGKLQAALEALHKELDREILQARGDMRKDLRLVVENNNEKVKQLHQHMSEKTTQCLNEMALLSSQLWELKETVNDLSALEAKSSDILDMMAKSHEAFAMSHEEFQLNLTLQQVDASLFQLQASEMTTLQRAACIDRLSQRQTHLRNKLENIEGTHRQELDIDDKFPIDFEDIRPRLLAGADDEKHALRSNTVLDPSNGIAAIDCQTSSVVESVGPKQNAETETGENTGGAGEAFASEIMETLP